MNKQRTLILVGMILTLSLHATTIQPPFKATTLREIYKSGKITFKRVLRISRDSIPDRIATKKLFALVPWRDKLYVSDTKMHDLKSFHADGRFYKKFSIQGAGPGDSRSPSHMVQSKERVLVWEIGNRRVSYWSLDGIFLKIEKPDIGKTSKRMVFGMKALDDGRVIFESIEAGFDSDNQPAFEWRVLDLYSSEMKFIREVYRQKENGFRYFKNPRDHLALPFTPQLLWNTLAGGKIVLCFSQKYEIRIMDMNTGQTKIFSHSYTPVKVSDLDKKEYLNFDRFPSNEPNAEETHKFIRENTIFPTFKPAIKAIFCDYQGNILVFPNMPSNDGKLWNFAAAFDAFVGQGNWVNHVNIQNNTEFAGDILSSGINNEFWMRESDEDFDIIFVKYVAM